MQARSVVVLVNADFETRAAGGADDPALLADAAVLDTAQVIGEALSELGIVHSELRVVDTLDGVADELRRRAPDVVFNLVESVANDYGREWEVPVLLEQCGLPYTGNGPRPLRVCRCKDEARALLVAAGVRVAEACVVADARALPPVRYPVFVKPARVDGSIGVDAASLCHDAAALGKKLAVLAASLPGPFLVERYLPGKELNVALFPHGGHDQAIVTELDFSAVPAEYPRFVTYDSKWNPESPEYASVSVPARVDAELAHAVSAQARQAFRALGGEGYGRVDLRLDAGGAPHVIDVNPNNDLHRDAGLARGAMARGIDYPRLIGGIVAHALERAARHGKM